MWRKRFLSPNILPLSHIVSVRMNFIHSEMFPVVCATNNIAIDILVSYAPMSENAGL